MPSRSPSRAAFLALRWRLTLTRAWLARLRHGTVQLLLRPRRAIPAAALALTLSSVAPALHAAPGATITVVAGASGMTAGDGCSLVEAITNANDDTQSGSTECAAGSGDDTIQLPAGATFTYTQAFSAPSAPEGPSALEVVDNLTIEGNGSTIQRAPTAPPFRLLSVIGLRKMPDTTLTLNNTTLTGGHAASDPALPYSGQGGAIYGTQSDLTLNRVTLSGSHAERGGGGLWFDSYSTATISQSTISGNMAGLDFNGGGINAQGELSITNSTISGNTAGELGAGMHVSYSPVVNIVHNTIAGNTLAGTTIVTGGGLYLYLCPPTRPESPTISATLSHNIISGNSADSNAEIAGTCLTDLTHEHNIIGHSGAAGSALTPGATDIVPTQALAAILVPTLENNGGRTLTHNLVPGSPAIDATTSSVTVDQRGVARPQDGNNTPSATEHDIGAVEFGEVPTAITLGSVEAATPRTGLAALLAALGLAGVVFRRRQRR